MKEEVIAAEAGIGVVTGQKSMVMQCTGLKTNCWRNKPGPLRIISGRLVTEVGCEILG